MRLFKKKEQPISKVWHNFDRNAEELDVPKIDKRDSQKRVLVELDDHEVRTAFWSRLYDKFFIDDCRSLYPKVIRWAYIEDILEL